MSIYIHGMEMPKDGALVEVLIWSDGHVTQTGDSYFAEDGRAYYQPCDWKYFTAVPVPEHGRLIDADAIHYTCGAATVSDMDYVRKYQIDRMPTIFPADKGGEA